MAVGINNLYLLNYIGENVGRITLLREHKRREMIFLFFHNNNKVFSKIDQWFSKGSQAPEQQKQQHLGLVRKLNSLVLPKTYLPNQKPWERGPALCVLTSPPGASENRRLSAVPLSIHMYVTRLGPCSDTHSDWQVCARAWQSACLKSCRWGPHR